MRYTVMFDYLIPQFTDIEVDAEDTEAAKDMAEEVFTETYPEAVDPQIVKVTSND